MSTLVRTESKPPPAVDERLVAAESRYEIEDGRVSYVAPADETHGTRHSKLSALLEAHVADDFEVASDMLTRTSESDDIAPDASVFPSARDPNTGGRQLEQLVFEIASTEKLSHAGRKARKLTDRGVRRVFVVDLPHGRVSEWAAEVSDWRLLEHDASIEDLALAVPLSVAAIAHAAKVDDAVAQALLAKRNPVLEAALAARHGEGRLEGKLESLHAVLAARQLLPNAEERSRLTTEATAANLDRWLARAATCRSVAELFD